MIAVISPARSGGDRVDGVGSSMFFMMALCSCNHHNGESKLPKWMVKESHAG
jgi:hypothetical protein